MTTTKSATERNTATPKRRRVGQRPSAAEKRLAQDVFLRTFADNANLRAACKAAGIDRSTVYRWQEHDDAFSFRFKQAEADANDVIRAAIYQRAIQGVDKPVFHAGVVAGAVREYSDTLLIFLAKSRMPEFRERQQVDISGQLDINGAADEADRKFASLLAGSAAASILERTKREGEG
jgi:hypothetical protein